MGLNKSSKLLIGLLLGVVLAWVAVCGQAEDLAGVQSPPSSVGIDSPALPAVLTGDDLLRQAREHLIENNFEQARTVLADSLDLPEEEAERLGGWLNDYQEFVAQRRSSREETAKKHVKEAQEHLKEKKFEEALASTYLAVMASPEPDSLRSEDWLDELTQLCVGLARKFSDEGEYGKSAVILSEIARIYDDDPTWKELSKDAGLHAGMLGCQDQ